MRNMIPTEGFLPLAAALAALAGAIRDDVDTATMATVTPTIHVEIDGYLWAGANSKATATLPLVDVENNGRLVHPKLCSQRRDELCFCLCLKLLLREPIYGHGATDRLYVV